jgi:hypothetical protein
MSVQGLAGLILLRAWLDCRVPPLLDSACFDFALLYAGREFRFLRDDSSPVPSVASGVAPGPSLRIEYNRNRRFNFVGKDVLFTGSSRR